ncbi:MAG: pentapeptide repeat-containing protein [Vampirovibrionales bacterium]
MFKLVYQAWKQLIIWLEQFLLSTLILWVLIATALLSLSVPHFFPELQKDLVNYFYSTNALPTWVKMPEAQSPNPQAKLGTQKKHTNNTQPYQSLALYFKLLDDLRRAVLTFVGGLIGVRTLILSLHKFEQTKKEERNKRFLDAAKLLGEGTSDVRIGGLISLEQLMKEDPSTMGERIVNLLVSFINNRGQYASKTNTESYFHPLAVAQREAIENGRTLTEKEITSLQATSQAELGFTPSHPPYEDIKLAFQILAERDLSQEIENKLDFDFSNIDHSLFHAPTWKLHKVYTGSKKLNSAERKRFVKANLQGANLQGANLQMANFQEAYLRGAELQEANLQMANLQKADLQGAKLEKANLQEANLQKAELQMAELQMANLQGAKLQIANLQGAKLQEANLQKADLRFANLQGADLLRTNLEGAELQGAKLQEANLEGTNLEGAYLREANFQGAELQGANLQGANLQGANLQKAKLRRANLQEANLQETNLQKADLRFANLQGADLWRADLWRANLQEANLQGAELQEAHLEKANLQGTNLQEANLQGTNLQETDLWRADLTRAFDSWNKIPLTAENLIDRGIIWSEETIFPDGKRYDSDGKPIDVIDSSGRMASARWG